MLNPRIFIFFVVFLIAAQPGYAQEPDSTESSNPLETMFRELKEVSEDPAAQDEMRRGLDGVMQRLGALADSNEAARERVQGMDFSDVMSPDSAAALMQYWSDRALSEAESGSKHLYVAPMRGLAADPPRSRLGELRVAASGLSAFGSEFFADVNADGELVLAGTYLRNFVLGNTALTTIENEIITEAREVPVGASPAQVESLFEYDGLVGLDMTTTAAGGTYVLALAPTGPATTLAGRTFDHEVSGLTLLMRLDDQGRPMWAFPVARSSSSWVGTLAERPSGGVTVSYDLDGGLMKQARANLTPQPISDAPDYGGVHDDYRDAQLLAAFDANGTRQWQQVADSVTVRALTTAPDGATYVVGHFNGASSFCGSIHTSETQQAAFAARLDPNGRCMWVQTSTGSTLPEDNAGEPRFVPSGGNALRAVTLGPDGDVYVTGSFLQQATFAGRRLRGEAPQGTGLVARLDAADGTLRWVKTRDVTGNDIALGVEGEPVGGYAFGHQLASDGRGLYLVESRMHRTPLRPGDPIWQFVLLHLGADGEVLWEELTGISSGRTDSDDGLWSVKLVEVPDAPPYILAPGSSIDMAGQRVNPPGEDIVHLFVGRPGPGVSDDPTREIREGLRNLFRDDG